MERIERRDFFYLLFGWMACLFSLSGSFFLSIRSLFPNVLYEPSSKFKLGYPSDYSESSVVFVEEIRTYILRHNNTIRALSAVCTHLGCTVNRVEQSNSYYCPCHGSLFDKEGKVISGPAPRPLNWYSVSLAKDGRILIDTKKPISSDKGLKVV